MRVRFGMTAIAAAATLSCFGTGYAEAGDDGAAPLWVGIGSIFGPVFGLSKDDPPPIDYRQHGKIVLPPKIDLPPPEFGRLARRRGMAGEPGDPTQEGRKGRSEEANCRRGGRAPPIHSPVSQRSGNGRRAGSAGAERSFIGRQSLDVIGDVIGPGKPEPDELGWDGQERSYRSRTRPRVADRSSERLPRGDRDDRTVGQMTSDR